MIHAVAERRRNYERLVKVGLIAAVFLLALPADAQRKRPPKSFQDKYFDAETAYRLGKLDRAERLFKEAGKIYKAPGVWRGLAAVYIERAELSENMDTKVKAYEDCLGAAFNAMKMNPRSRKSAELRKLHSECRKGLGRTPYRGKIRKGQGVVSIITNEIGAQVKINGNFAGGTPLRPKPANAGRAVIVVTKFGSRPQSTVVDVLEGVVTDVVIDFSRKPKPTTTKKNKAKKRSKKKKSS